jgi:N-acetylneuraminic acid mutarotase
MRPSLLLSLSLCANLVSGAALAADHLGPSAASPQGQRWQKVETTGEAAARHENSAVLLGNDLYVFGGRGERPLQALDLKTQRWRALASPPLEMHHAQAVAHGGRIFVVSGLTGQFPEEPSLEQVHIYDPATDAWSRGPDIPLARRRGASGVVVVGDLAYIVGGNTRGHNSGHVPWTDTLNLVTGEWSVLPDAPHSRDHFHAAVVDGRIYAAGGRLSAADAGEPLSRTVAQVDVYDPASGTWSTLDANLPTPRAGTAAVQWNGQLVVLGGESDRQVAAHAEVEAFDPRARTWTSLPSMPAGRHGTQAVVNDNAVWITAGSANRGGGPELNDVLRLMP